MFRKIDSFLLNWKNEEQRKVLLLRGARQVGKTYSIRQLGKSFKYFIEINFEQSSEACLFFSGDLDINKITERLSLYAGKPVIPGETLLFLDEIQACPNVLRALRFFYEQQPALHVAAAGSLLEFALKEIPSYGVGRIQSLFMYPMTFEEYLYAAQLERFIPVIKKAAPDNPVDDIFHNQLLEQLRIFMILGGMPEIVKTYLETRNLVKCQLLLDNLTTSYYDDFAKYKARAPVQKIREVFNSIVRQTGRKFKYSNIGQGKAIFYKEALDLLVNAGLAYKIFHTSANGLPLMGQINEKRFKVLLLDTGLYQRLLGFDISSYMVSDYRQIINKGNLAELFAGLMLLHNQTPFLKPQLFYWHREAKSSNAEVDYIISKDNKIIPIEVKSGEKGQMQSMHLFLKEKQNRTGIRTSHENFTKIDDEIQTVPLYAIGRLMGNQT